MAKEIEVRVPDIGDFEDVEVVEVLVAKGDHVAFDDPLVSIESDKATMELPAPEAGEILSVEVSVGDRVSEGALLARMLGESGEAAGDAEVEPAAGDAEPEADRGAEPAAAEPGGAEPAQSEAPPAPRSEDAAPAPAGGGGELAPGEREAKAPPVAPLDPGMQPTRAHASPLVRGMARELGVDLAQARGTGPADRVLPDDVKAFVRERLGGGAAHATQPLASGAPTQESFARFGAVEEVPLPKIRRVAAVNLARAWQQVPHVTQHDDADVTALERFRKDVAERAEQAGVRLSPLVFVLKALVAVLRRFPDFRSSLAPGGEALIVKNYYHLGVAVDTENGLVVPVLRDVDRKGIFELAGELAEVAERARNRKLAPADLQGGVFSISSLGGIGGTHFTPIVNAPEVAILGLSRMALRPVWNADAADGEGAFEPRTLLPLSLSYDHRVIDGAAAARFTSELGRVLSDPVQLLL